jgi:hypothetical protein
MTDTHPSILRRVAGLVFILLATASLLASVVGIYGVWSARGEAARRLDISLAISNEMLVSSDRALLVLDLQLRTAGTSVTSIEDTARTTAATLQSTQKSLSSASVILRQDVPAAVAAAQKALISAQSSARLIDDVLGTLDRIPFLNIQYQPEMPLYIALGNVAKSLDGLPQLTINLGASLDVTAADLPGTAKGVSGMADTLGSTQSGIKDAQKVIAEFRDELASAKAMLQGLRRDLPAMLNYGAAAVTFLLFWLGVVQVQVMLKGLRWLWGG